MAVRVVLSGCIQFFLNWADTAFVIRNKVINIKKERQRGTPRILFNLRNVIRTEGMSTVC